MNNNITHIKKHFKYFVIILLFIIVLSFLGCQNTKTEPIQPISKNALYFDTLINITIYDSQDESLLDECFKLCDFYEQLFSATIEGSDVSKINQADSGCINVSPETVQLISDALYYSKITEGLYDITIYPVSLLWDFHGEQNFPPDSEQIKYTIPYVNYKNIFIKDEKTIIKKNDNTQLELGSIAKGYIADLIAQKLEENNVHSAIINIGGDIHVIGEKDAGSPFVIGIKDPNNTNEIMSGIKANNICIATSGTYERCFEYDGNLYHHILDPRTGYPVSTDVSSVTIVTDSSKKADALCTCSILLGGQNALQLIETEKNTEAFIKLTNGDILKSSGIDKYIITSQ